MTSLTSRYQTPHILSLICFTRNRFLIASHISRFRNPFSQNKSTIIYMYVTFRSGSESVQVVHCLFIQMYTYCRWRSSYQEWWFWIPLTRVFLPHFCDMLCLDFQRHMSLLFLLCVHWAQLRWREIRLFILLILVEMMTITVSTIFS